MGKAFNKDKQLHIVAIPNASSGTGQRRRLTKGFNNAFPSTDPQGKLLTCLPCNSKTYEIYMCLLLSQMTSSSSRIGDLLIHLSF